MKYCINCGTENNQEAQFCKNCGRPLKIQVTPAQQETAATEANAMNKKKLGLIIGSVVLLIAIVGTHTILKSKTSAKHTIEVFHEAIETNNVKKLQSVINLKDTNHYSDKDWSAYLSFLKNQDSIRDQFQHLYDQEKDWNGEVSLPPVYGENGNGLFQLVRKGKKLLFYKHFVIEPIPFKAVLQSDDKHVTAVVDGKTISSSDLNKGAPIDFGLPIDQKVEFSYIAPYAKMKKIENIHFTEADKNKVEVFSDFPVDSFNVISYYEDPITIILNGKETKEIVKDGDQFGPILTDGSTKIEGKITTDLGEFKSDEIKVTDDSYRELDFTFPDLEEKIAKNEEAVQKSEDLKMEVSDFVDGFMSATVYAYNSGEYRDVQPYIQIGAPAAKEVQKYMDHLASKGITEDLLSSEVIDINEVEDGLEVSTKEEYEIYQEDGESSIRDFKSTHKVVRDSEGELKYYQLLNTEEI
jgi:uncharacterized membrane protein YvbJ